jgi:modulator of FtsH protease HflC
LRFKLPFNIDRVQRFPDVVLEYDAEPREIVLADKKKLEVDNYARWRIINPLLYRVGVQTERNARERLDDVIYSVMREELGRNPLIEVIRTSNRYTGAELPTVDEAISGDELELATVLPETSPMREDIERGREEIMQAVTEKADALAREEYGIQILDVRIKRADLLPENLQAVFGRMQAERQRISDAYRSEGQKEADIIEGETDRQVEVIGANAERDAKILRGEGDAEAISIISAAFRTNPELYRFMRSLEVLEEATPVGSEVVIGLDSGLFHLLQTNTLDE